MKTLILTESTQKGTDKRLLETLITKRSLLSGFEVYTVDKAEKTGSITDVLEYIQTGLP